MPGWEAIPGAAGCTAESCGFRDHHDGLLNADARAVFGLSTQPSEDQQEAAARLALPFELLSDSQLEFSRALALPTFEVAGTTLLKRLTIISASGVIEHVFYPVFPPDAHAGVVMQWLRLHPSSEGAGR